jgi:hypothetical protein
LSGGLLSPLPDFLFNREALPDFGKGETDYDFRSIQPYSCLKKAGIYDKQNFFPFIQP